MGAGAWGTALAKVLADAGNNVDAVGPARRSWPTRSTSTHRNPDYLGDIALPKSIRATSDPAEALDGACTGAAGGAVADAARQPRALDGPDRRRRHAGQPGQGHRAGHADADEPGHRAGDRCRPVAGRGASRDRTWPARSPTSSRPPPSSRAATPAARWPCSAR